MANAEKNQLQDNAPVDFAIMTALRVEREAMLQRLDRYERIELPDDPYVYFLGQIDIPGSTAKYKVVVAQLIDVGNVNAATEATALIKRWQPQNLFMVGIAGGVEQEGVAKGDVIVANLIYYYEMAKRVPVDANYPVGEQRRDVYHRCDRILYAKAKNYEAADWKSDVKVSPPLGSENYVSHARFGPIGCGELVIADETTIPRLLLKCPKMLAVAMEGAGIAQAAENEGVNFLEVRGISDLANPVKDDRWHLYAANAAAAFVRGFLRSKPIYSLSEKNLVRAGAKEVDAPPIIVLRAEGLRQIRPDEILASLPDALQKRDHETVGLDFTDLTDAAGKITNLDAAVTRLTDTEGNLLSALGRRGSAEFIFHGLAQIPLVILAGYLTTDRQAVHLFDFHPSPRSNTWTWPDDDQDFPELRTRRLPRRTLKQSGEAVVRVSISYPVLTAKVLEVVPKAALDIEMGVLKPERGVIRSEAQVRDYGRQFRQALDLIAVHAPHITKIHLFYAGPVALAFHLGQQISENIHPPVVAWNYSRSYEWGIDLAAASAGTPAILTGLEYGPSSDPKGTT